MWECDFAAMIRDNPDITKLSEELELLPRLDPRRAFFGGRTNAVKLYHESSGDKKIGYVDICSLYPTVLKYDVFPVGKPQVIIDPGTTDISSYFGIVQCRIHPPRGIYHPVLPVRVNGKLMFPLCLKCAKRAGIINGLCGHLQCKKILRRSGTMNTCHKSNRRT